MSKDLLDMEKINSLPHPLSAWHLGRFWPIHDIDVQTGLMRIDACGMLDVLHFGGLIQFRDSDGKIHDPEDFYLEEA